MSLIFSMDVEFTKLCSQMPILKKSVKNDLVPTSLSLNGISLHSVGFELFKKVLLVALGIWISIF